ncbi:MAG TPA: peptidoglycan-associated lipoprotein Pal [Caulobacteraceae bacterium]|jgi:peptidoglycan-associated lipoprotein
MQMKFRTASVLAVMALAAAASGCAHKNRAGPGAGAGAAGAAVPGAPGAVDERFTDPDAQRFSGPARPGTEQEFVQNVGDRVYFDYDRSDIRADARPILDSQAAWLARYNQVRIRIEGNADERGTREYNFALGNRRAQSVMEYLTSRGVSPGRMTTVSYGKERPVDPGTSDEAHARNRNGHTAIVSGTRP